MRYLLISILFILSLCGSVAAQNTTPSTSDFYTWPIVSGATGQKATVAGKIDLNKYSNVSNLKIELVLSLNPGFSNAVKYNSHKTSGGTEEGVSTDGTYFWSLGTQTPTLTPSTTYYIRQNIYEGSTLIATKDDKFNSSKGYIPEGSQEAQDDFNSRSYHLLAPWPGLAVLMDPDLCMQQKAEGKVGQDAICDINGFLNFAFKTLIGLTAVALVLRLIYEGYQYMTTDIPFIQANAKSGFGTALLGLLLALSAYLILNTINPKLVTNDVSIAGIDVSVEDPDTFTSGGGTYTGGTSSGNVSANIATYDVFLKASASAYGIDYRLAKAHMYAESAGKPNAQSNFYNAKTKTTGHAYGLMQLTKETFESMGYSFSSIYDPKTNIEAGVRYMSKLKTIGCDGRPSNTVCSTTNISYRIAAYNGGPVSNRVSNTCSGQTRWQCSANKGYLETRNYVSKVLANQQVLVAKNW